MGHDGAVTEASLRALGASLRDDPEAGPEWRALWREVFGSAEEAAREGAPLVASGAPIVAAASALVERLERAYPLGADHGAGPKWRAFRPAVEPYLAPGTLPDWWGPEGPPTGTLFPPGGGPKLPTLGGEDEPGAGTGAGAGSGVAGRPQGAGLSAFHTGPRGALGQAPGPAAGSRGKFTARANLDKRAGARARAMTIGLDEAVALEEGRKRAEAEKVARLAAERHEEGERKRREKEAAAEAKRAEAERRERERQQARQEKEEEAERKREATRIAAVAKAEAKALAKAEADAKALAKAEAKALAAKAKAKVDAEAERTGEGSNAPDSSERGNEEEGVVGEARREANAKMAAAQAAMELTQGANPTKQVPE